MSATKCLREEHQVILRVLGFFSRALDEASASGSISHAIFDPFVGFFQGFADHCHHCKEESRLFPALQEAGMPGEQGPIAVMLHEHQQGRALVRHIAANLDSAERGDEAAKAEVLRAGTAFVSLLSAHIEKEDQVLFNVADSMLEGEAAGRLLDGYSEAENEEGYYETHVSCSRIVRELASLYEDGSPLRVL